MLPSRDMYTARPSLRPWLLDPPLPRTSIAYRAYPILWTTGRSLKYLAHTLLRRATWGTLPKSVCSICGMCDSRVHLLLAVVWTWFKGLGIAATSSGGHGFRIRSARENPIEREGLSHSSCLRLSCLWRRYCSAAWCDGARGGKSNELG